MKNLTKHTLLAPVALPLLASLLLASTALAQGALMINPKRVVLDDRHRFANVTLFNSGNDSADFVISLVHYKMNEDGSFTEIPDSVSTYAATYCDKLVRYFPLQVTLAPHESQAVRVQFLKPQGLQPGEYRSHLYFRSIDKAKAIETQVRDTSNHTISLTLRPIFGISIPVIVDYQTKPPVVSLDSGFYTTSDSGKGVVMANLNRTGDEECYGSLVVMFKDKDGHEQQVGIVKGLAVYTDLATRKVQVAYQMPKGVDPKTGSLLLEFQTLTDNPKESVLATTDLAAK